MSEFNTIEELTREIEAKRNHLKTFRELMDRGAPADDFASGLSYMSELGYYYSIVDELKELEYKKLDMLWGSLGIDTKYEEKTFTEEERQEGVLCGSVPVMSAPYQKGLDDIEKRILAEYHKRNNGIPSHTMGAVDCPDCKIPMGLHSYHCNCCGWHDSDKQRTSYDYWNSLRKKREREREREQEKK